MREKKIKIKTSVFKNLCGKRSQKKGFSLIEVVVATALVGVAMLGLAQLFMYGILTNSRADKMANSIYLAQQQIDSLRSLTAPELTAMFSPFDEQLDVNNDGSYDFRRITQLEHAGYNWNIHVLVFSSLHEGVSTGLLIADPPKYKALADFNVVISR